QSAVDRLSEPDGGTRDGRCPDAGERQRVASGLIPGVGVRLDSVQAVLGEDQLEAGVRPPAAVIIGPEELELAIAYPSPSQVGVEVLRSQRDDDGFASPTLVLVEVVVRVVAETRIGRFEAGYSGFARAQRPRIRGVRRARRDLQRIAS